MVKKGTNEIKIMDFGLAHVDLDEGSNITREGVSNMYVFFRNDQLFDKVIAGYN